MAHRYTKGNVPEYALRAYMKVTPTRAFRVSEPFEVETREGDLAHCSNGWLAVDPDGWPYPIPNDVFIKQCVRLRQPQGRTDGEP